MSQPSVRARLTRTVLLVSLAGSLAMALLVGALARHLVIELLDSTLQESAEILYALVQPMAEIDSEGALVMPVAPHEERLVWQVVEADGQELVARSHRAPAQPLLPAPLDGFADSPLGWRVRAMPLGHQGKRLYVGQTLSERHAHEGQALLGIVGITWILGLISALWLGRGVRRELEPLERLSGAVRAYDPLQAGSLPPVTRRELLPVQQAIEDLGQRLARLIEQERAFSAHAAHALRTPLAGMDAQLAIALREAPPAIQPRLRLARQAAQRLTRVVGSLLGMFRSAGQLQRGPVDLAALAGHLPVGELQVEVVQEAALNADADLLAAAFSNLFDNAARHGARRVRIEARRDGDGVLLDIRDDGSGIDAPTRERLQRGLDDPEHADLSGLGLVLASLVARAHGGELRLEPGGPGAHLTLRLADDPRDRLDSGTGEGGADTSG